MFHMARFAAKIQLFLNADMILYLQISLSTYHVIQFTSEQLNTSNHVCGKNTLLVTIFVPFLPFFLPPQNSGNQLPNNAA